MNDAPYPERMLEEGSAEGGAMGAGAESDAPDLAAGDGGDATGGGSPGDQDAMGGHQNEDESALDAQIGGPANGGDENVEVTVSPGTTIGQNPEPGGGDVEHPDLSDGSTPDADLQPEKT